MSSRKRLLTGLQPSGDLHIGNYFGALQQFLEVHGKYESFLMVADYHSLTSKVDPEELRKNIFNIVRSYLAVGVDPKEVVIFKQSDVLQHLELGWIFNCLVSVPFLMQAHAYKDKTAKGLEANAGLLTYPMLQAADILLYDPEVVPVGEDQRQHIEYSREAAKKFNITYGETFVEPKELIMKSVGVVPGTDGQKMSKSYKNTIPLFGSSEELKKAVMSIVTDSEGAFPEHVFAIHSLYRSDQELKKIYEENSGNYKTLKELLFGDIEKHVAPMREKYMSLSKKDVIEVLEDGADRARTVAEKKMQDVRKAVGVAL